MPDHGPPRPLMVKRFDRSTLFDRSSDLCLTAVHQRAGGGGPAPDHGRSPHVLVVTCDHWLCLTAGHQLCLTAGRPRAQTVTDLNQTIDAVVDSSSLPMSIVIVGVQNEVRPAEDWAGRGRGYG